MLTRQTPNPDLPHVRDFCQLVAQGQTPILVPCQPVPGQPVGESMRVVPQYVATNGGEQLNGWAIRETPGLFIEAEAYCVWRDPQGNLIDITKRQLPDEHILFITDDKRPYSGPLLDTIRRPLVDNVNVTRFLRALTKHATLSHQLDQAEEQGALAKADRIDRDLRKVEKDMAQLHNRLTRLI